MINALLKPYLYDHSQTGYSMSANEPQLSVFMPLWILPLHGLWAWQWDFLWPMGQWQTWCKAEAQKALAHGGLPFLAVAANASATIWKGPQPSPLKMRGHLEWEKERGRAGSVESIHRSDPTTLGGTDLSRPSWYLPKLVTHKIMNTQNSCWLKPLNFGVVCYSAIANWCIPPKQMLIP